MKSTAMLVSVFLCAGCLQSENWAADNGLSGKVGVFCHFLPNADTFGRLDACDVKGLVSDLKRMHPDYFILTLGQNDGYYCAPNATLERMAGYTPHERCSQRDIPAEIIAGLKGTGIRFGLYLPNQPASCDAKAEDALGFKIDERAGCDPAANRIFTDVGSDNWAMAIAEWSKRYGGDVAIWWFDGGYEGIGFSDVHAAKYKRAVRIGNSSALVAFNAGVDVEAIENQSDYWAGEERDCLSKLPKAGGLTEDGRQWHVLSFLGSDWGEPDCRFEDAPLRRWISEVKRRGGAVTLDVHISCPGGRIPENQIVQFAEVR